MTNCGCTRRDAGNKTTPLSSAVRRIDGRDPTVLHLCERVADKLTREALANGLGCFWYAERNDYGYPQVFKVRF